MNASSCIRDSQIASAQHMFPSPYQWKFGTRIPRVGRYSVMDGSASLCMHLGSIKLQDELYPIIRLTETPRKSDQTSVVLTHPEEVHG